MKTNGLLMALTLAGLMLFSASLYAQQEVSPSWYDPWQAPDKVTAHVSQSPVAKHTDQPTMVSAELEGHRGEVRARRIASRRTVPQSDRGRCCHPCSEVLMSQIPAFFSGDEWFYWAGAERSALPLNSRQRSAPLLEL
jgi:hypothetical protein